jgi:hypothetical protein
MKLTIINYIKLKYWFSIFNMCRTFSDHITDKESREVFEYWEVKYKYKIVHLLQKKRLEYK